MHSIYIILNSRNSKCYVGQTGRLIGRRWYDHKYDLRKGTHVNPHLQRAWILDGEIGFEWFVIYAGALTKEEADEAEIFYKCWFDSLGLSYNIKEGGSRGKLSMETRAKLKGKIPWNKGIPMSDETREKCSLSNIGMNSGSDHYLHGKNLSADVIAKREESRGEHVFTDETRAKLSESQNKRWQDPELRAKVSREHKGNKHNLGHKLTEEQRKRLSIAHIGTNTWTKGRPWSDLRRAKYEEKIAAGV